MGAEIDFILEGDDQLIPVEVKWQNITNPTVPRNFISFFKEHDKTSQAFVVTKNFSHKMRWDGKTIYFVPSVFFNKFVKTWGQVLNY